MKLQKVFPTLKQWNRNDWRCRRSIYVNHKAGSKSHWLRKRLRSLWLFRDIPPCYSNQLKQLATRYLLQVLGAKEQLPCFVRRNQYVYKYLQWNLAKLYTQRANVLRITMGSVNCLSGPQKSKLTSGYSPWISNIWIKPIGIEIAFTSCCWDIEILYTTSLQRHSRRRPRPHHCGGESGKIQDPVAIDWN